MNILDIILLGLLLIGGYRGFQKGVFIEVIGIFALILAIVGGFKLLHLGIDFLNGYFGDFSHLVPFLAFILIFIGILILVNMIGKAIKKGLDFTLLGSIDNFAGGVLGVFKWAVALSIFMWLTSSVGLVFPEETIQSSFIYRHLEPVGPKTIELVSSFIPYAGDLVEAVKGLIQPKVV